MNTRMVLELRRLIAAHPGLTLAMAVAAAAKQMGYTGVNAVVGATDADVLTGLKQLNAMSVDHQRECPVIHDLFS